MALLKNGFNRSKIPLWEEHVNKIQKTRKQNKKQNSTNKQQFHNINKQKLELKKKKTYIKEEGYIKKFEACDINLNSTLLF